MYLRVRSFGLASIAASFDLFAAVVYPIVVLAYCYSEFDFDREVFQLYVDHLPPGSFERLARMIAGPSEIALFLAGFDSLRILSVVNLLLRISMSLSFCNRFRGMVDALLRQQRRESRFKHNAVTVNCHMQQCYASPSSMSSQRRVPRVFAAVFVAFGVATIVYSERAMAASWSLCAGYPQCVVFAQRWRTGETCTCLTLIDVDAYPRTYANWMSPIDATGSVRTLSASGDLRVLQLINHGLRRWPDELRRCHNLQYVYVLTIKRSVNLLSSTACLDTVTLACSPSGRSCTPVWRSSRSGRRSSRTCSTCEYTYSITLAQRCQSGFTQLY